MSEQFQIRQGSGDCTCHFRAYGECDCGKDYRAPQASAVARKTPLDELRAVAVRAGCDAVNALSTGCEWPKCDCKQLCDSEVVAALAAADAIIALAVERGEKK